MNIIKTEKQYILQTYKRQPLVFTKANGKYIWDEKGKKYLDFFTGISVCSLGHCHPAVTAAASKQLKTMAHVSNHYFVKPQAELARMLVEKSFGKGKVFFSNSGAEANECAIKLARKRGNSIRKGKNEIITFENSFHGRTLAALAATGQTKFHKGFDPMPRGFKYAKFNDIDSVKRLAGKNTCAIMIEPIIGEGGIIPAGKKFLQELRALCNKISAVLIFDEIQCGMGRTGKLFAYQYYGVEPDVITLAKSIANGLPLSATIIKEKYAGALTYGDHGSTFGGNPVACAAAVATLNAMTAKLLKHVENTGEYLYSELDCLQWDFSKVIKEVRGIGMMVGFELYEGTAAGAGIVSECAKNGLIINCTQQNVIRFLPPVIITNNDVDFAIKTLRKVLTNLHGATKNH